MKKRMTYAARIWKSEYGYEVDFPQLGIATNGTDMDNALSMAGDALETYLTDYENDPFPPPEPNLDIDMKDGGRLVAVSVYVEPNLDCVLATGEVMQILGVNRQRVAQLRNTGRIKATRYGKDYLHSRSDVEALKHSVRRSGRPKREVVRA